MKIILTNTKQPDLYQEKKFEKQLKTSSKPTS